MATIVENASTNVAVATTAASENKVAEQVEQGKLCIHVCVYMRGGTQHCDHGACVYVILC